MLKKTLAAILSLVFALSMAAPAAFAAVATYPSADTVTMIKGQVAKTTSGMLRITTDDGVYLASTPGAREILDATTLKPMNINDIRGGDTVIAYVSQAMTKSAIPQTVTVFLLGNLPMRYTAPDYAFLTRAREKDNPSNPAAPFGLLEGKAMKLDENRLLVAVGENEYLVNLGKAYVFSLKSMKLIEAGEIKLGEPVVAYIDAAMTNSLPPQANGIVILTDLPAGFKAPSVEEALAIIENMPAQTVSDAPVTVWGVVEEKSGSRLVLKNSNPKDPLNHVVLNVSEDTIILDAVEGEDRVLDTVKKGDIVYGYVKPVMATSMPPQVSPILLLTEIPADFAVPGYHVIDSVSLTGAIAQIKTTAGEELSVPANVELLTWRTDNMPSLADVKSGKSILVWSNEKDVIYKVMLF